MKQCVINQFAGFLPISVVWGGMLLSSCSDDSGQANLGPGSSVPLFDGSSLAGWTEVRDDGTTGGDPVWSVVDGVLTSNPASAGYIYSEQVFQDFELVLDWRWASEVAAGDAGVLLRITGEPQKVMPKCIEAQIRAGGVGDVQAYRGATLEGDGDRYMKMDGGADLGEITGVEKTADLEKEAGQWNRCVIVVKGGNIEVKVNDELVNTASGLEPVAGRVGLQSVGGSMQIDYIQVTPL